MLKTDFKRTRGRPSKAATKTTKKVGKKRGRGRPLGSKNKILVSQIGPRIERIEQAIGLLADILTGVLSKLSTKKGK